MRLVVSLASVTLLLAATSASASEWHPTPTTQARSAPADQIAREHLEARRDTWRLTTVELQSLRTLKAGDGKVVRFAQRYQGLQVLGAQAAVRIAADGRVTVTNLAVRRELQVMTTPSISKAHAGKVAVAAAKLSAKAIARTELVVHPDARGGLLVWLVDVYTLDGGRRYLIDAQLGNIVSERSLAVHAKGRVYPISAVSTPLVQDVELVDLVESTPQLLTGWAGNLIVTNYVSGSAQQENYVLEQVLEPNSGADFLFDPPMDQTDPKDGFAQVGIYYHLTRMRSFFNGLGVDTSAASWKLVAVANVFNSDEPMDNAFFSQLGIGAPWSVPNLVAIGQGEKFDFAQDSDVFNHELTHYVTHNAIGYNAGGFYASDYGRSPFSAAIDEGLSDYFSCTVNDDPMLGEASLALLGVARDLTDTSKSCPDDMTGESHADGEIIGSVCWSLRTQLGKELADELVWSAATMLSFGATFAELAKAVQQTAADMVDDKKLTEQQKKTIDDTLDARGLVECDAELPLRVDEPRTERLRGFGNNCQKAKDNGYARQTMFHYFVTPGSDAEGITVNASIVPEGSGELSWGIYGRKNTHVTFTTQFPTKLLDHDYAIEDVATTEAKITIDAQSDPPFDPAATYHFVIRSQNCVSSQLTLTTEDIVPDPPVVGGGGAGGDGGGGGGGAGGASSSGAATIDSGCGCRAPAGPDARWQWLAAAFALVLWRRRVRRRRDQGLAQE